MSTTTTRSIASFSGNNSDFQLYLSSYQDVAASSSSLDQFGHGLLGFLLNDADYMALPFPPGHVIAPFIPLQHPGPRPVFVAAGANALAVSVHNVALSDWTSAHDHFVQQLKDLSDFKAIFVASLDPISDAHLRDPTTGMRQVSIAAIHAYLVATYGVLSSADLAANEAILRVAYQAGASIRVYTATQRKAHATALANNQPFAEAQKVQHLLVGLGPCAVFDPCLVNWRIDHPTVALQTFDLLVAAVHAFADSLPATATTGSMHYAAAVTPLAALTKEVAALAAAFYKAQAAAAPAARTTTTGATSTKSRPKFYCWTHGMGHSSDHCRFPAAGHQTTATAANKMGGHA